MIWLNCVLGALILLCCVAVWLASLYSFYAAACPMQPCEMKDFVGPVDLVYTWVDGHDKTWAKSQDEARMARGLPPVDPERNPTPGLARDELYHSVRLAQRHLPWHRRIYILTQKPQRPRWLPQDTPRVRVVHHEDVFSPHANLPSYNGILNASQAHRIPGLAEHFIYLDDDHFVGQPLDPGHFFDGKGRPVYKLVMELAAWFEPSPYAAILRHTHRLVRKHTPSPWLFRPNHLPIPLTRSACYAVEDLIGPDTLRRMDTFRSNTSYDLHYVVVNYLLAASRARRHPPSLRTKFLRRVRASNPKRFAFLADAGQRPHMFCINAGFDARVSEFFDGFTSDRPGSPVSLK